MSQTPPKIGDTVRHRTEKEYGLGEVKKVKWDLAEVYWPDWGTEYGFTEGDKTCTHYIDDLEGGVGA